MITRITLRNWKSHADTTLAFGKGTNLLIGVMGAGKSSVMDALSFALFGTFPALHHKRVKLSDVITDRPVQKGEAWVEATFTVDGAEYAVQRKLKTSGVSEAYLRLGERLLDGPQPQRVTEYVERLLKLNYETFSRAVYSEQNRIDYFLTLSRGERKKQIDELLGIDRFETVRAGFSTLINRVRAARAEKASFLKEIDITQLEAEHQRSVAEVASLEEEANAVSKELKHVEGMLREKESAAKDMERRQREFRELENKRVGLERTIAELRASLEERRRGVQLLPEEMLLAEEKRLLAEKNRLDGLEKIISEAAAEKRKVEAEVELLAADIKSLEQKIAGVDLSPEGIAKTRAEADELERKLEETRREAKRSERRQRELGAELAVYGRQEEELVKKLEQKKALAAKLNALLLGYGSMEALNAALRKEEELLEAGKEELRAAGARISELESFVRALIEAVECPVCGSSLDAHRREMLRIKKEADREQTLRDVERLELSLEERAKSVERIAKTCDEVKDSHGELAELKEVETELKAINEKISQMRTALKAEEDGAAKLEEAARGTDAQLRAKRDLISRTDELLKAKAERERKGFMLAEKKELAGRLFQDISRASEHFSESRRAEVDFELQRVSGMREIYEQERRIFPLESELADAMRELGRMQFSEDDMLALRKDIDELSRTQAGMQEKQRSTTALLAEKKKSLEFMKTRLEGSKKFAQDIERLDYLGEALPVAQNCVIATQSALREQLIEDINAAMQRIWLSIYPYSDYRSVRLRAAETDYWLEMQRDESWASVDAVASGGERSCASLTLRIAFAMVLVPNLSWLVLDEPTHNLDAEGVKALATALRENIPNIVEQVFVITHDEALKEAGSARVYLLERDKNRLEPTRAEQFAS